MKTFFVSAVMLFVVLTSIPTVVAQTALYDDFSSTFFNPDKWVGSETGNQAREAFRSRFKSQLRLTLVGYCDILTDSGDCESSNQLHFTTPGVTSLDAVTFIQATMTPFTVTITDCPANTGVSTSAGLELVGFFFNNGASVPGNHTNDVRARIGLERSGNTDPANTLHVNARVVLCTNADCTEGTEKDSGDLGALITAAGGSSLSTTVSITWSDSTNQLIFQRDAGTPGAVTRTFNYGAAGLSNNSPAGFADKRFQANVDVQGCSTTPRPSAFIQGLIDDVFINANAVSP